VPLRLREDNTLQTLKIKKIIIEKDKYFIKVGKNYRIPRKKRGQHVNKIDEYKVLLNKNYHYLAQVMKTASA